VPAGLDAPRGKTPTDAARAFVARMQACEEVDHEQSRQKQETARVAAAEAGKPHDAETWDGWFKRYLVTKECGDGHRNVVRAIHAKWISPVIGPKPVRELTRDHVEDVRDKLDRAIDAGEIRPATGHGVWAALTSALKAACASRDRSLRVQPPKTAQGQRLIPIHPNLLPILVAMKGKNSETVGTFPAGDYGLAGSFRMYLARAGVTRSRLTADNATLSHHSAQEGGTTTPRTSFGSRHREHENRTSPETYQSPGSVGARGFEPPTPRPPGDALRRHVANPRRICGVVRGRGARSGDFHPRNGAQWPRVWPS